MLFKGILGFGAAALILLGVACEDQSTNIERCAVFEGFPELASGWVVDGYSIPTRGKVTHVIKLPEVSYDIETLPNGVTEWIGPFYYRIRAVVSSGGHRKDTQEEKLSARYVSEKDNLTDVRYGRVALRPVSSGLEELWQGGWRVKSVSIPTRGRIEYFAELPGETYTREMLPDGSIEYKGRFWYEIRGTRDPDFLTDTRQGSVILERASCPNNYNFVQR